MNNEEKSSTFDDKDPRFTDTTDVHAYLWQLARANRNDINCINTLYETFLEFRNLAERTGKQEQYVQVKDKNKALPLSLRALMPFLDTLPKANEPPLEFIVIIAQQYYNLVANLFRSLHLMLRSDREKTPLNRAQRLDSQCIRWLARQPGRTPIEKAGNAQKILSIVRHQSYDTLENRVFKQFLQLCVAEGHHYLTNYQSFKNSQRIKDVRRFVSLAEHILESPEFMTISRLTTFPHPNYVLQNNASYCTIWNLYVRLVQKTKFLEIIWKHRNRFLQEYIRLMLEVALYSQCIKHGGTSLMQEPVWIHSEPSEKSGFFLDHHRWLGVYQYQNHTYETGFLPDEMRFRSYMPSREIDLDVWFVPGYLPIQTIHILPSSSLCIHWTLVYRESESTTIKPDTFSPYFKVFSASTAFQSDIYQFICTALEGKPWQ